MSRHHAGHTNKVTRRGFLRLGALGAAATLGGLNAMSASAQSQSVGNGNRAGARQGVRPVKMIHDGFLWLDAEDFADYGGWRLDTQFVHQMGSAFLIAAGTGVPLADATTEIEIPRAARWRVWVRARNWLPEYSPGRFTLDLGGRRPANDLGAGPTDEWAWEQAGDFDLPAGPLRVALVDLTGYFGRCDAILFTTDTAYSPPAELGDLERERARLTGRSLDPVDRGEYEVVVAGAGVAGFCAAMAAARLGRRTVLVHDRPVLGGNGSEELGVGIAGAANHHPHAREGGILEEAARLTAHLGDHGVSKAFRLLSDAQANLTVVDNHRVVAAETRPDGTIAALRAVNTLTGEYARWRGRYFIDCTGDGWVGYYAGAKWRMGRESREEFGEDLAPAVADGITMSGCLMDHYTLAYLAEDTGAPVEYVAPPWATRLPDPEDFLQRPITRVRTGEWWIEAPGDLDDLNDAERARDELVRITFGYWDYVKNRWPQRADAVNYALRSTSFQDARRETRRLAGDYWFKQQDAQQAVVFPDRIAHGGWPLDIHHPRGILSGKEGPFTCNEPVPLHSLPYRILYSVNVDNLLMAGRDVSATHIGLGTVRVQATLGTLGQAAGTAAALCLDLGVTPRELGRTHIARLQQTLLRHDQFIPELRNEDPADLARAATVTASSTAAGTRFGRDDVDLAGGYELTHWRAVMFPRGANRKIQSVSLALESRNRELVDVILHVRGAAAAGDYADARDLATRSVTLGPRQKTFVHFPLDLEVEQPFVWLALEPARGVFWGLMHTAPAGSSRAYRSGGPGEAWEVRDGQFHAFAVEPPLEVPGDYRPENILNGVTRVVGGAPNQWASDPDQSLPQWIELAFPAPTAIDTVQLTFDSDFNRKYPGGQVVRQMVRDYKLEADDGAGWRELAREAGNYQRRRVHTFAPLTALRLRLTVLATCGDRSARVFEIRAYHEGRSGAGA